MLQEIGPIDSVNPPGRRAVSGVCLVALLVIAIAPLVCLAQSSSERPRIGLVLSGGGARGAAHVGVLKVLEELRIPVDSIAGTSMGSVVGGLYACGLSPDEIESSLRTIDWDEVFDDSPPRRHLPFRRKRLDQVSLFDVEVGVGRDGLEFPEGLVAGQKLDYLLETLTLHCSGAADFDDLPIPFRAVATDLDTGERVVLWNRGLARAMRASMAVPGAFTPVESDGRLLVDGGLVCNLPVDLVRSLGADVVIAVDISPSAGDMDGGGSAVEILVRSLYLLMDQNLREQAKTLLPSDVLVVPDLGDMNPADFHGVAGAMDLGEEGAHLAASELSRLSVSEEEFETFLRSQRRVNVASEGVAAVDVIQVVGMTRVDARIVMGAIRTSVNEPLRLDVLRDDLDRIYELGDFESVGFRLSDTRQGRTLTIEVKEKSWGPHYVRAGFTSETDFEHTSDFTTKICLIATRVNARGGEWQTGLSLGSENGILTELYQPLDFSGLFFVSPRLSLNRRRVDSFTSGSFDDEYLVETFLAATDVGLQLRNHGEARAGIFLGTRRAAARRGGFSKELEVGGYSGSLTIDQLDNPSFPTSGSFVEIAGTFYRRDFSSESQYARISLNACSALSIGDNVFTAVVRGETSPESVPPVYDRPVLGGLMALSGYERNQLQGSHMVLGEILYYRRLKRLPSPFGTGVFAGVSVETGNVWDEREDVALSDLRHCASVFIGADTLAGPMLLGWGMSEDGDSSVCIALGRSILGN